MLYTAVLLGLRHVAPRLPSRHAHRAKVLMMKVSIKLSKLLVQHLDLSDVESICNSSDCVGGRSPRPSQEDYQINCGIAIGSQWDLIFVGPLSAAGQSLHPR